MRSDKIFNSKFHLFAAAAAVSLLFQFSLAADEFCSKCVERTQGEEGNTYTVCNCQQYCETSYETVNGMSVETTRKQDGCFIKVGNNKVDGNYYTGGKVLTNPAFEPEWTEAISNNNGMKAHQYIQFKLDAGTTYRWTTYDKLDDYYDGEYYLSCETDADCEVNDTTKSLKCLGKLADGTGFCMWPFDTELTLIDTANGTKGCSDGTVVAFSKSGGTHNQSELEYKAPRNMEVVLLVTNNKYNDSTRTFDSCQDSKYDGKDKLTTLKWQRYVTEPCKTCGKQADYQYEYESPASTAQAPEWSVVQDFDYINAQNYFLEGYLTDVARLPETENWIKPGSYIVFDVQEGNIYRWSTCKSVFYDTQLTLFKGEGTTGNCGHFLAFNDDSENSYQPRNEYDQSGVNNFCPAGTKQSVLEWHANFTGKVTLLFSEYNCSQCVKDENAVDSHWKQCFDIQADYVVDTWEDEFHTYPSKIKKIAATGMPMLATSNTSESDRYTLHYLYSFPLDWQRYDCKSCTGSAAYRIVDKKDDDKWGYNKDEAACGKMDFSGWTTFCTGSGDSQTCGNTVSLQSGKYVTMALVRGSKYYFETPGKSNALITIKSGSDCANGKTLAQGRGRLAYFAEASADCQGGTALQNANNYTDVITVLVSEPECDNTNPQTINLKYAFYPESVIKVASPSKAADAKGRFAKMAVGTDTYYEDLATKIRFIETDKWVKTWDEAINTCQGVSIGGAAGAFDCPSSACPTNIPTCTKNGRLVPCYTLSSINAKYCAPSNDDCEAPVCSDAGYFPYGDTRETDSGDCALHPEWCGLCLSRGYGRKVSTNTYNYYCDYTSNYTANTCVTRNGNDEFVNKGIGVERVCSDPSYVSVDDHNCIDPNETGTS